MCNGKDHNLIEILTVYQSYDEEIVVRWCKDCGAIVVDIDYDGRTYAGRHTSMQFPEYLKYLKKEINK